MTSLTGLQLARLTGRLHHLWLPSTSLRLDPVTALGEFRSWLEDEHWWLHGRADGWIGLCNDVIVAFESAGDELQAAVGREWGFAEAQLKLFLTRLRGERKKRQPGATRSFAARGVLEGAEADLRAALSRASALGGAWAGLVRAAAADAPDAVLDQRQIELMGVGELAGHPWDRLLRLLGGLLADVDRDVDEARRDVAAGAARLQPGEPAAGLAGLSLGGRLALTEQYLSLPVDLVASEVWVAVDDAFFDASFSVGPVTFHPGLRLRKAAVNGTDRLPARVAAHRKLFEWLWEDREQGAGFGLAEVRLPPGSAAVARHDARATVAALCRMAEFDEGYSAWRVADRGLLQFVGEDWVWREKLDPGRRPEGLTLAHIARDATPSAIRQRAPHVAPFLPLSTASIDVRHVMELIRWLSDGRATSGAARIVLTKRVIERVAGWSGVNATAFADEQLAIPWARSQTLKVVGNATRDALRLLSRMPDDKANAALLEAATNARHIIENDFLTSGMVHVDQAVEHFGWILNQLPRDSSEFREMQHVENRVASRSAYAGWVDEFMRDFRLLHKRYSRQRNAIVHGGPADDQAADTLILFADALAVDVLAAALDAVVTRRSLRAHFARRNEAYRAWLDRLRTTREPVGRLIRVAI